MLFLFDSNVDFALFHTTYPCWLLLEYAFVSLPWLCMYVWMRSFFCLFHFHFRTYSVYTMEQQYSASTMESSTPPPGGVNIQYILYIV